MLGMGNAHFRRATPVANYGFLDFN